MLEKKPAPRPLSMSDDAPCSILISAIVLMIYKPLVNRELKITYLKLSMIDYEFTTDYP